MEQAGLSKKEVGKMLITLAIPTILEQILSTLLQYVDTAMVGHLGEQATASVSITTPWIATPCAPTSTRASAGMAGLPMTKAMPATVLHSKQKNSGVLKRWDPYKDRSMKMEELLWQLHQNSNIRRRSTV